MDAWVPLPNGRRIYANVNDELIYLLLFHGALAEDFETRTFAGYVRPGDTIFDVGANYGTFTLAALNDRIRIAAAHLVEPNPAVAACLRVTQRHHDTLPLVVHECAISDRDGEAIFHVPVSSASVHGALDRHEWGETHGIFPDNSGTTVAIRTIDSICDERRIRRIDCLKIDVEGHESAVVRGMSRILDRCPPRVVMCETAIGSDAYESLRRHYARVDVVTREGALMAADTCEEYWGNIFFTQPHN